MKVWLIDDEQSCLDELAWQLKQFTDIEVTVTAADPCKAIAAILKNPPDAVFLDIDMPGLNGLEAALAIQEHCPGVIVIFVTAHAEYSLEAYKAYPLDFLLKPVGKERLEKCIGHMKRQYILMHPGRAPAHPVKILCFGRFEFVTDSGFKWGTRRVKELLLYLISRCGAAAPANELLHNLFGDNGNKNTKSNLYMTLYRLKSLFHMLDPEQKSIRLTAENALILASGVCDYTDFMRFTAGNAVITEKNIAEAARVLTLYRGSFLENEPFEWAADSANEAEIEYERLTVRIALFYIAKGRFLEAESVLTELLIKNALCEEAYTMLLDLYMKTGNRPGYLELYLQYVRLLKKELHIKPAGRYRDYYAYIRRKMQDTKA